MFMELEWKGEGTIEEICKHTPIEKMLMNDVM